MKKIFENVFTFIRETWIVPIEGIGLVLLAISLVVAIGLSPFVLFHYTDNLSYLWLLIITMPLGGRFGVFMSDLGNKIF